MPAEEEAPGEVPQEYAADSPTTTVAEGGTELNVIVPAQVPVPVSHKIPSDAAPTTTSPSGKDLDTNSSNLSMHTTVSEVMVGEEGQGLNTSVSSIPAKSEVGTEEELQSLDSSVDISLLPVPEVGIEEDLQSLDTPTDLDIPTVLEVKTEKEEQSENSSDLSLPAELEITTGKEGQGLDTT
ncbi:hypothetical protein Pmani_015494 [Petrolisthes manimaculis]|uniref:Uncharacterized protein n=1 Tax=Petrolisthes manimaculis TaxID=1843537 RepID=A0AAE1PRJ0_9EUCA|nr:hypothetical protein Pmani_015494 [Petrolisthes manimaculis]